MSKNYREIITKSNRLESVNPGENILLAKGQILAKIENSYYNDATREVL